MYWFSLNNSEMLKAVTLAFCSIQWYFIRDIRDKFGIPYSPRSPYIGQYSDGSISDFQISGQSFIKRNCHNSRISDDIDIKVGPVTELYKRNKTTSKTFDNDAMSENCDVIANFPIYHQFSNSGCIAYKNYIFFNSNFLSCKNWKQN